MKNFFSICGILLVLMITIPLFALPGGKGAPNPGTNPSKTTAPKDGGSTVRVLVSSTGKVETLSLQDYLIGVVGAEMPANYQAEALKAQAVASSTYLEYSKANSGNNAALKGADISDDSSKHQAYLSAQALKEKWKDNYDQYYAKIQQAVSAVLGYHITYQDQPILASFFSLSSGKTNAAKAYWGTDFPYLQSVESNGDKLSPTLTSTVVLSADELKEKLKTISGVKLPEKPETWFSASKTADSGLVTEITVGGKKMTGKEVREALELKSAQFSVAYQAEKGFTFTVKGYGHNVGMSQYGADYMARQGADFKEILEHYYTGVKVVKA